VNTGFKKAGIFMFKSVFVMFTQNLASESAKASPVLCALILAALRKYRVSSVVVVALLLQRSKKNPETG
jgi:hypothetical protein